MTGLRRPRATLFVLSLCLFSVVGFAPRAFAQDGATLVAVVTAEPNAALTRRVKAELQALGVDVIVLKPPAEASSSMRAPLEQAARSVGAVAAIRLIASREGKVEVWVADRVTGKAVVRELEASGQPTSDTAIAVGTVELLRASLMELHTAGAGKHGDAPPTPKIVEIAGPPPSAPMAPWVPRLSLTIGGGMSVAASKIGIEGDAQAAVWLRLTPHLGARAFGAFTIAPAHVDTQEGSVDIRSQVFGAALVYDFNGPEAAWAPNLALGVAGTHIATSGTAAPPFVGTSDDAWAFAPMFGAGLARSLARGLRVRLDATALFAIPTTRVNAPAETIGKWGAPEILGSLGFELLWAP